MPDWLQSTFHTDTELNFKTLIARQLIALALGCVVAGVYRLTHGRSDTQSRALMATIVLLTVLICMVTLVIGNSVARAFSLVGALAIVRFRTVVADTRDTAFVIFAVAVGMAIGAGLVTVPLIGVPIVTAAAFLFRDRTGSSSPPRDYVVTVRIAKEQDAESLLRDALQARVERSQLTAIATARQGTSVDYTYAVRLRRDYGPAALAASLNGLECVQGVELRQT